MAIKAVPRRLQAILWSADVKELDLEKHKGYIIHQVLRYGTLGDIQWLFGMYSKEKVRNFFLAHPSKNYTKEDLYFITHYILNLENKSIDMDDYVTSLHGPIRQRTAGNL